MPDTTPDRALLDAVAPPLHPLARETLLAAIDAGWADPARLHREGRQARLLLDQAREILADGLGLRPDEVSFHASAAHALDRGIRGLRSARRRRGSALVTSAVDQALVLRQLEPGRTPVPVDQEARVLEDAFAESVRAEVVALAVLAQGNAEVGTLQPVAELHETCERHDVPLLLDVAGAWGRVPVAPEAEAYAGHAASFSGPPLGVLGVRSGTRFRLDGPPSGPELGRELAGPWVPLALAAAEAWRQSAPDHAADAARARRLIDAVRAAAAAVPDVQVVGDAVDRLPHVVTFSALYVDGEALVHELDRRGFAVASGSACTADTLEPSHVLAAMGAITHGNVRITLPMEAVAPHRAAWVERFCAELPEVVHSVRSRLEDSLR